MRYKVVVIGGGPAGLGAAIEAKKNGANEVLIIERDRELGGILNQCIHNGFGLHEFKEELTGPEYAQRFIDIVDKENIEYMLNTIVLDISKDKKVTAIGEGGLIDIEAEAIILAMGCRERSRGAIDIAGYRPAGVYNAGSAQRFINIEGYMVGNKVIIYGSGDIGLIMARRMTLEGAKVIGVVERKSHSSGLTRNIVQCLNDFDIPLMLQTSITYIHGKERLEGVTIAKLDENKNLIKDSEEFIECDTLLLAIGLIPENELSINAGIDLDDKTNGPIVNNKMETNIEGIFACGNVVHVHDLVDFVTKESKVAGKNAALYSLNKVKSNNVVKVVATDGIGYIVPQYIDISSNEDINLFMRVKDIYKNKKLILKSSNKVIIEKKKTHMAPSEMQHININKELLKNITFDIYVGVEEV